MCVTSCMREAVYISYRSLILSGPKALKTASTLQFTFTSFNVHFLFTLVGIWVMVQRPVQEP